MDAAGVAAAAGVAGTWRGASLEAKDLRISRGSAALGFAAGSL